MGNRLAMPGRTIPFRRPSLRIEAAMVAPELPADTIASALPSLTRPNPTMIVESFFFRIASTGDSCMDTVCEACSMDRRPVFLPASARPAICSLSNSSGPSRITSRSERCSVASRAPLIKSSEPRSPPVASRAIRTVQPKRVRPRPGQ